MSKNKSQVVLIQQGKGLIKNIKKNIQMNQGKINAGDLLQNFREFEILSEDS